jgi:hypothetical protein
MKKSKKKKKKKIRKLAVERGRMVALAAVMAMLAHQPPAKRKLDA